MTDPLPIVEGIDVSVFQGRVDWAKVAGDGKRFAIIRATIGLGTDANFAGNVEGARRAGLLVGTYHASQTGVDPNAQAQHYAATALPLAPELAPVCDFEGGGPNRAPNLAWARAFTERAAGLFDRRCALYTYPNFWDTTAAGMDVSWVADTPLWLARYWHDKPYTPAPGDWPQPLAPWGSVGLWQYSGDHGYHEPGVGTPCDHDRWRGTEDELMAWGT